MTVQDALTRMVTELRAERALVLTRGKSGLDVAAAHNFEVENFWQAAPVSVTLLEEVAEKGHPLLLADGSRDPVYGQRWSLVVAEIRSLVCAPYWRGEEIAGVLYADVRVRKGMCFTSRELQKLVDIAQELSGAPKATQKFTPVPYEPQDRPTAMPRPAGPAPKTPKPPNRASLVLGRVRGEPTLQAFVVFYRCLATMIAAGVRLDRSLLLLAEQSEDKNMAAVCKNMALKVQQGQSIYQAARSQAAFPIFHLQLIRLGERSGSVDRSFEELARHLEGMLKLRQRIQATLTYPLFLSGACLLMLILAPPFVLRGQLEMIGHSGQSPPFITQLLMWLSDLVSSPWLWALLGLGGAAAVFLARQPRIRRGALKRMDGWPTVGRLLRRIAWARFAQALALQLKAGLPVLGSLPMAAEATAHPLLEESIGAAEEALRNGATVSTALAQTEFFPRDFLQMVEVAEESGRVPELMQWVGRLYEQQLENALEAFAALLEPVVLCVMGVGVGFIVLATMLPMAKTLQAM